MTLAYAILMPLMPEDEHGLLTGFYSVSGLRHHRRSNCRRVVISLTASGPFSGTKGFQGVWLVCAVAALSSLVFIRRLKNANEDRRDLEEQ